MYFVSGRTPRFSQNIGLLCVLRKTIVQWHLALGTHRRVRITQFIQFMSCLSGAPFWGDVHRALKLEMKYLHPSVLVGQAPLQSFEYRSSPSSQLLDGVSGYRCVSRPHLARHRKLINAGEEKLYRGDEDTCHHSSTSWSVTDKYSPRDMNLTWSLQLFWGRRERDKMEKIKT